MKKGLHNITLKSFLLFVSFVVISVTLLLTCFGEDKTNVNDDDGGGGTANMAGTSHTEVHAWKITLFKGKDTSVTKESPVSDFNPIGTVIFYNGGGFGSDFYTTSTNKFEYIKNLNRGITQYDSTSWNNVLKISDSNIPIVNVTNNSNAKTAKEYFGISENEAIQANAVRIINQMGSLCGFSIDTNKDLWLLLVEPMLGQSKNGGGTGTMKHGFVLTATDYAVMELYAEQYGRRDDLFSSTSIYRTDGAQGRSFSVTLSKGLATVGGINSNNENWFGLGNYNINNGFTDIWFFETAGSYNHNKPKLQNIIRYGGASCLFSKAFEFPDYTVDVNELGTKWENETATVTSTVYNSNPVRGGDVTVKLTMQNPAGDILIDGAKQTANPLVVTKTVNMLDKERDTVSWQIDVGTYSKNADARTRNYSVTVEAEPDQELITDNNSSGEKTLTLNRDFAISDVRINGSARKIRVQENTTVTASFDVVNNNPYRSYDDVAVSLYLYRVTANTPVPLTTKIVTLGAGEVKHASVPINVGSVSANIDSVYTIVATVNLNGIGSAWRSWHENNTGNNKNTRGATGKYKTGNVVVQRDLDCTLQILAGEYSDTAVSRSAKGSAAEAGADGSDGGRTTGMVTCVLKNKESHPLYPTDASKDKLTVEIDCGGKGYTSPVLCAPLKGTNLTWFSFTVPKASSITFNGKLILRYIVEDVDDEGNVITRNESKTWTAPSVTAPIKPVTIHETPDTKLDRDQKQRTSTSSASYSTADAYSKPKQLIARWDQWQMNGSTFVLHKYALAADIVLAQLNPLNLGGDKELVSAKGEVASGSGFTMRFTYKINSECSESGETMGEPIRTPGNSTAGNYTLAQNAVASFPEFNYRESDSAKSRTLFFTDTSGDACSMYFAKNLHADGQARAHFIPVNMPDGTYKVGLNAYDLWTPAGMIHVAAAPTLQIKGSIYDYGFNN